jgi:hypothetical protein
MSNYLIAPSETIILESNFWHESIWNNWILTPSNVILENNVLVSTNVISRLPHLGFDAPLQGVITSSFFDIIYNQIWMRETYLNFGSITSDYLYDFYIWNATFQTVNLESVIPTYLDTNIYFLDNLEGNYTPLRYKPTKLIIKQVGPFSVNGYYLFDFTPPTADLKFKIEGFRLFLLPFNEYISENFELTYNFLVVISQNLFSKEQRRLLIDRSKKQITASFIIDNVGKSSIPALLKLLDGVLVAIPYSIETLTPVANNLFGLTNIYVQEDFSQYFELFRTKFIFIYDKSNNNVTAEKIVNLQPSLKLITIEKPINKNFYKRTTKIYPANFYIVTNINETFISKTAIKFDIELEEGFVT